MYIHVSIRSIYVNKEIVPIHILSSKYLKGKGNDIVHNSYLHAKLTDLYSKWVITLKIKLGFCKSIKSIQAFFTK